MNRNERGAWRRASPFSVLYFLGRIARGIARNFSQLVAPLAAFFIAWQGDVQSKIVLASGALLVFSVAASLLRYLAFRYRVDEDAIRIRDGVLQKKELKVRFDRVQGVTAEQNFVFRMLGLVTLSFDTAGSGKSEGVLPALGLAQAEALRDRIGNVELEHRTAEDDAGLATGPGELLLALDWRDMIRIGLADGRALVLLAFLGPLLERAGDRLEAVIASTLEDAAKSLEQFGAVGGAAILVALALGVLCLFALLSILAAFLRYHDFHLYLQGTRLRSSGGLLTRHDNAMRLAKIQIFSIRQGIALRLFRRFRLVAKQASSAGRDRSARHFIVPLASADCAGRLTRIVFEPEAPGICADPWHPDFVRVSRHYLRPRILLIAALPALLACVLLAPDVGADAAWALAWLPAGTLVVAQHWRRLAYRHDNDGLIRRAGWLGVRTEAFLFRKVQRVSIRQSWFQRRRGLANLRFYTAAGSVSLPYLDARTARRLRDYALYRAESSDQAWY